ncbi:cell division protein FtsA [Phaeodactylibacter xiamenensis]|jgi:cell division protein FtsA|uniref:Cell division protein FtsA n=1 Tax=Phaeodactylibacter xiamenensis TaxID=1524460 RepID=A0A098S410_9BACT|nr:cell division protein FtsA [Phaeodactylibacter xiamenensis]MCR9052111.1 cell division protein FtsA [bacterium]
MSETNVNKSEIIVALDIGTTKICAIAGRRDEHGKIEVLGFGKVASEGVLRGVVSNIEKTVKAIAEAVNMAQRTAGQTFKVVHVGIAGQHIKSLQHRGILTRDSDHTEISRRDIDRLISDMFKLVLPPGDKILHVIPQEYTVDNEQGITDPIGMSGIRLEANFHIITGQISASNNIHRCVERTGLKVANMTLEPIASASAVLSEEEKEAGVALVDIGGGTTDITIFQEGIIRHTAVIPFGGNVITKDIKEGCTVMKPQAEKLKVKFGSALAEEVYDNRIISIPGLRGQDHKEISEKNLARIIQARVEEILDYVIWEIRRSGFERKLIGGIVLTGGGALLNHIDKLSEYHTGMSTRIGTPVEHLAHGYHEHLSSPIYSTGVGLLIKGLDDLEAGLIPAQAEEPAEEEEVTVEKEPAGSNWYDQLFKRTKEWFEAEPDNEF